MLRALVTAGKQNAIDIVGRPGTDEFHEHMLKFCRVVSTSLNTKARAERLVSEEARIDLGVLESAIENARKQLIHCVVQEPDPPVEDDGLIVAPASSDMVIDIRQPSERSGRLLRFGAEVLTISLCGLPHRFAELDGSRRYLLYCERGMMSRLYAVLLLESGNANVAVLNLAGWPAAAGSLVAVGKALRATDQI